MRYFFPSLLFVFLLFPAAALAQESDGAPVDDVPRTVEFGIDAFAGYASHEFFDSAHGGVGPAIRIKDVVTLRIHSQFWGANNPPSTGGARHDGWGVTVGAAIHPFKFYNSKIPHFWLEPYFASDVGVGHLFSENDSSEFLVADFLWGVNFNITRPWVLYFEGGVLYVDFDDKEPQPDLSVQSEIQGGIRYFF
ncbi:MAG: hypothetical protein AB1405_00560 [Bdellovibrionota bacterium]